jgi:transposase InsO family protein
VGETLPKASLLLHSERGAQYTALSFGKRLEPAGIVPSMSRVGSALDNAISESFVSTLKSEIGVSRYPGRQPASASIFEFIEGCTTGCGATRCLAICARLSMSRLQWRRQRWRKRK